MFLGGLKAKSVMRKINQLVAARSFNTQGATIKRGWCYSNIDKPDEPRRYRYACPNARCR